VPRIYGTISDEMLSWVDKQVAQGKFYNHTHVIKAGIMALQEKEPVRSEDDRATSSARPLVPPLRQTDGDGGGEEESEDGEDHEDVSVPEM